MNEAAARLMPWSASGTIDATRPFAVREPVVQKLPPTFGLHDVYEHQQPLVERRPHVQEMEATIRNAMQRLRDMGYVEFLARGEYRRID